MYKFVRHMILFASMMPLQVFATEVSAKKDGVKVLSEASKTATVLKELKKNEVLKAKDRKGMYWEVDLKGKQAFVSVMEVQRQKSDDEGASNAMRELVKQGRDKDDSTTSRARSGVMGVRGLDESGDTAFAGNAKPNLRLVYSMEDMQVDDKEIEEFGGLVFSEIEKKSGL